MREARGSSQLSRLFLYSHASCRGTERDLSMTDGSFMSLNADPDVELLAWRTERAIPFLAPALALVFCIITVLVCSISAHEHIPDWQYIPYVDFYGAQSPERYYYSFGFAITAIMIVYAQMVYFFVVNSSIKGRRHTWVVAACICSSVVAAAGLLMQAMIPLQPNIMDPFLDPFQVVPLHAQSILHQSGFCLFFVAACVHCFLETVLLFSDDILPVDTPSFSGRPRFPLSGQTLRVSRMAKLVILIILVVSYVASAVAYSIAGPDGPVHKTAVVFGGCMQWLGLGCFLLFLCTYCYDLYHVRECQKTATRVRRLVDPNRK